jgi:hypothetical protein
MQSISVSPLLSLGALTALTSLQLMLCSIEGCCDVYAWLASQLAHLPRLRAVDLQHIQGPYAPAGAAALASRLQQLQGLTWLRLAGVYGQEPDIPCPSLILLTQLSS